MALEHTVAPKRGVHYDLAKFALSRLKSVDLFVKGNFEIDFENNIISKLKASPTLQKHLRTQIGLNEPVKITPVELFGFSHKPDACIDDLGTAIEIKVISTGQGVRDIIGQAVAYRMLYRFVILVIIAQTQGGKIIEVCRSKGTQEYSFLTKLASTMNIFTIIGPLGPSKNLVFGG